MIQSHTDEKIRDLIVVCELVAMHRYISGEKTILMHGTSVMRLMSHPSQKSDGNGRRHDDDIWMELRVGHE